MHDDSSYQPDTKDSLRHMTVLQLHNSKRMHSTAPFKVDGKDYKYVILVGNLSEYTKKELYTSFTLDDGTGKIQVHKWNEGPNWAPQLEVDAFPYIRVIGQITQYKERKKVEASKIETCTNPYEPYHHLLSAIYDNLACQRGRPLENQIPKLPGTADAPRSSGTHPSDYKTQNALELHLERPESADEAPLPTGEEFTRHRTLPKNDNTSAIDRSAYIQGCIVYELQNKMENRWGVHVDTVIRAIFAYIPDLTTEEFSDCIEILVDKGYIYTTINEGYYSCTNVDYMG